MAYTPEQKANALAILKAEGGNISRAARITGITRNTLKAWRDEQPLNDDLRNLTTKKAGDLAALFEQLVQASLEAAAEKISEATYKDLMVGAAVGTDKLQLLRGQPTEVSRVENVRHEPTPDGASVAQRILQRRGLLN